MAGSHHTARQPTRLSSIGKRSARAVGDRRRTSEADLRRGIYVRPLGLGYHVVRNQCNDQEYVVADATNSTFKAGQVVALGSFTGNPGEFVLGKPPAGFGGASGYGIQPASAGYGVATTPDPLQGVTGRSYYGYCCAWDSYSGGAIIPVYRNRTEGGVTVSYLDIVLYPEASLPVAYSERDDAGTIVASAATISANYTPIGMCAVPGPRWAMVVIDDLLSYASGLGYRLIWFGLDGEVEDVSDPWNGPDWFVNMASAQAFMVVSGGQLYTLTPDLDPTTSGSPSPSMHMVRKWSIGNAAPEATYSVPSVSPFHGVSSSGQWAMGITPSSAGGVDLWLRSQASPVSVWRRPLDSALSVGTDVNVTGIDNSTYYLEQFGARMVGRTSSGLYVCGGGKVGSGTDVDFYIVNGVSVSSDLLVDAVTKYVSDGFAYKPNGEVLLHHVANLEPYFLAYIDSGGTLHLP